MNIKDISPFVRIAFLLKRTPYNKLVKNADCRIFYIVDGHGKIIIENTEYEIEKDAIILLNSGTTYQWDISKKHKKSIVIINFDYNEIHSSHKNPLKLLTPHENDDSKIFKSDEFEEFQILNNPIYIKQGYKHKAMIMKILEEFEEKKPFFYEKLSSMMRQLIIDMARQATEPAGRLKIEHLIEYINENFNSNISNSELAKMMHYHPNYINRLMKEYTGTTLHAYIIQCRMNNAHNLIINTKKNMEEIAYDVGFKNPTHFYKIFHQTYGISPSECRKNSRKI